MDKLPERERVKLVQFAQQMESLGILVAEKPIDIDLVDKTLGSFVMSAWEKYKPMFVSMRKDEPYTGEYFQWLAEQIEKRLRETAPAISPDKQVTFVPCGDFLFGS